MDNLLQIKTIYLDAVFFIILIIALFAIISVISYRQFKNKFFRLQNKPTVDTKEQLPKHQTIFVDLSTKSADIVELAVEVWRINNRIMKAESSLSEIQKRGLESSLQKFVKFLDHNDVRFIDHTGQKYNEGMNIEVLSFEKDQTAKYSFIKETIEPSITCNGMVVKKGKVVVINN